MTLTNGVQMCNDQNAVLPLPLNEDENESYKAFLDSLDLEYFALDFHLVNLSVEQRLRFDGTEVLWSNWKDEEAYEEEDCGLFWGSEKQGKWTKWGCTWGANIVCERPYEAATQPGKNSYNF